MIICMDFLGKGIIAFPIFIYMTQIKLKKWYDISSLIWLLNDKPNNYTLLYCLSPIAFQVPVLVQLDQAAQT